MVDAYSKYAWTHYMDQDTTTNNKLMVFYKWFSSTPKRNGVTEHMGFFLEIGSNILDFLYSKVAKANY